MPPPIIVGRDRARILAELVDRVRGYVPEWRPTTGTPGAALLQVFARTLELEGEALDRMPSRMRLAFLDALGNNQLPAQSARAPLVFTLMDNAPLDVTLPARSQVAAKLPPPPPPLAGQPAPPTPPAPLFFVEQTITLTRGKLAAIYSVDPDADTYRDHSADRTVGFTLFDGLGPIPHAVYFGHDTQLKLVGTAEIVLSFNLAAPRGLGTSRPLLIDWEYLSANGWLPLAVVVDETARLTADGRITLRKSHGPDAKEETIAGHTTYWIRGTVSARTPSARIGPLPGGYRLKVTVPVPLEPGQVITIDSHSTACVIAFDAGVAMITAPLSGVVDGVALKDAATLAPIGTVHSLDPEFVVPVEDGTDFLAGDVVTVDTFSTATITGATRTELTLDGPITGAAVGERIILADGLPPLRHEGADEAGTLPEIDVVRLRVGFSKTGLVPDAAYVDTVTIDVTNTFKPFGARPEKFTTFYVAAKDAFQRAGAHTSLVFSLAQAGKGFSDAGAPGVGSGKLAWSIEYYDGAAWTALGARDELRDDTKCLTEGTLSDRRSISFITPADWTSTKVNGDDNLWLRIRIDSGNYGHPLQLSVTGGTPPTVVADPETLTPPIVASLTVDYTYYTNSDLTQHCLTFNDFAFADHTEDARWPRRPFAPFVPVDDQTPAVHLGFTIKPPVGLMSLFSAAGSTTESDAPPTSPFVWEYFGAHGWTELGVADETAGFARTGLIQFIGAPDALKRDGVGGLLYRVRARLKPGERTTPLPIAGLWPNGVWARQGESVQDETIAISNGNPSQTLVFPPLRIPVMPGEIVEVREWTGRGDDWETSVLGVAAEDLRFDVDPRDGTTVTAVWVRWHARQHLLLSGPNDRHYTLERATGVIRFGAPPFGMIPPAGARIVASFTSGGGVAGNVPAGAIVEMRSGVGYVQTITNPLPAAGGTETEGSDAARDRSTARLRHRLRAVAAGDYEWIAREASPEVARARCLSLNGPPGTPLRGHVTLLVVPQSIDPAPSPTPELAARVLAYVRARVPAGIGPDVRIVPPVYVAVGIKAEIALGAVDQVSDVARVEARVRAAIAAFLHPLTGGPLGRGFAFGESVYLSHVAALIEAIEGVDFVRVLQLTGNGALKCDTVPIPPDGLPTAGDHELKLFVGDR